MRFYFQSSNRSLQVIILRLSIFITLSICVANELREWDCFSACSILGKEWLLSMLALELSCSCYFWSVSLRLILFLLRQIATNYELIRRLSNCELRFVFCGNVAPSPEAVNKNLPVPRALRLISTTVFGQFPVQTWEEWISPLLFVFNGPFR